MSAYSKRTSLLSLASLFVLWMSSTVLAEGTKTAIATREVKTLDGRSFHLQPPKGGATAVVFYSGECPISNAYSPTLNDLRKKFPETALKLLGVCVDPDLADQAIRDHSKEFALRFPVARDRRGALAKALGATVTPEAFVIDDQGRIRYHGRIDDQYAARQKRNARSETHELQDAIALVLAGKTVPKEFVPAVGCPLPDPPKGAATPTFNGQVSSILQTNCRECHRPGRVGPFSLVTYEQARKRAGDIAEVVESRRMPPWKPSPGVGPRFLHDKSLSQADIDVLLAWADSGAPRGEGPEPDSSASQSVEWSLGKPDLVLQMDEDFEIPAKGSDIYRCFVLKTDLPKDVYISAIEYLPGNSKVVHHLLAYVDVSGEARKRDEDEPGPGYSCFSGPGIEVHGDLGGWAPGNEPSRLPEGIGRALPKGADVVIQVHYNPSGKIEKDRSKIGLHFSRTPIRRTLHWSAAINTEFELPPGEKNHEVVGSWKAPCDLVAYGVTPHMHLLGRDMLMSVKYPDGRTLDLVKIDDWDFNWQNTYYYAEPLKLPKGTVLKVVAHYDNSADNPRNPNRHKPVPVHFGEKTTDEMCIGFIALTKDGQDLTKPGEKDDLREILKASLDELKQKLKKQEKQKRDDR